MGGGSNKRILSAGIFQNLYIKKIVVSTYLSSMCFFDFDRGLREEMLVL
jgi:hypothetical protein